MASFTTSARGFFADLDGLGSGFAFFALGGVCERSDSSSNALLPAPDASSSDSGVGRFLDVVVFAFAVGFSVVCVAFLGAALVAVVFLGAFGAALALGF